MTAATDIKNALLTALRRAEDADARTPPSAFAAGMASPAQQRSSQRARQLLYHLASAPDLDPELAAAFTAYLDRSAALLASEARSGAVTPGVVSVDPENAMMSEISRQAAEADPLRNMKFTD